MTFAGFITHNGLRLAAYGAGNAGPPLVFQHGLCGDARQIAEAMQGLGNQGWHGLECSGHGASPMADPSIARFADAVAALIETLPAPVVLGGISMGAAIACRLAVTRPDLLRALILVRPAWVTQSAPANMAPNAEVGMLLMNHPAAEARAIFTTSATAQRRQLLKIKIQALFGACDGTYGYRRLHQQLVRGGERVGPELVRELMRELMRELGLVACQPRP